MWLSSDRHWFQVGRDAKRFAMQASRTLFDAMTAAAGATARAQ